MSTLQRSTINPRYFQWRGKPTLLIGSTEHYGAVLNLDFDYRTYLATLQRDGLNLTRLFVGGYRELPGTFNIAHNTLAPAEERFICPWPRIGDRYDLSGWNEAWFQRLTDFAAEADRCGVAVEVVLFCYWYTDDLWAASPWNAANNIQGIGKLTRHEAYLLRDPALQANMEAMTQRVVQALNPFDNVYFEIFNEPYSSNDGTAFAPFQQRIAAVIEQTERSLPKRHLVAINVANCSGAAERCGGGLPSQVNVLNFHYARPSAVAWNYHLALPIVDDETGFAGQSPEPYRWEAWEFMLSGGAGINHLDYSFTCAHPDGTAPITGATPGYGGPEMRRQLRALKQFMEQLEFWNMQPIPQVAAPMALQKIDVPLLADPDNVYAAYIRGVAGGIVPSRIGLLIPSGRWRAQWFNPPTGNLMKTEDFDYPGGWGWWTIPPHPGSDAALVIRQIGGS